MGKETDSSDNKDDPGIEILKGHTFSYGTTDQVERFINTRKAVAQYAATEYENGKAMWQLVKHLKETTFQEPTAVDEKDPWSTKKKYELQLKQHMDNEKNYARDKAKCFRVIMAQCEPAMRNTIENIDSYDKMEEDDDVIKLLKKIIELVYSTGTTQYEYWVMQASVRKLITMTQDEKESLTDFHNRFVAQQEVSESVWGKMIPQVKLSETADKQEEARQSLLACVFLAGVDRKRYKAVVDDLHNDFHLGKKKYPSDTAGMLSMLTNRRGTDSNKLDAIKDGVSEGASFVQDEDKDSDKPKKKKIKCFICEGNHYVSKCPKRKEIKEHLGLFEYDDEGSEDSEHTSESNSYGFKI